ncbi:MAG: sugar ABC transporter ATP-binding protein [Capsulimonadaceae bacterium]
MTLVDRQEKASTEPSPPILRIRKITKRFAGVVALRDVDLDVYRGEILGLIGENGAGKSTLMNIIGGVHTPSDGAMEIDGAPYAPRGVAGSIRAGIGFIHQELNVLDNLDIAGNVFLGREPLLGGPLRLLDRARMIRDTQPHLDRLGLAFPAATPLDRLSLAQRQMVEIAKALSQEARIVIMDEPTSSLTLTETERLIDVIRELKATGVAVVYISHRLAEVKAVADRVVGLRDGRNAGTLDREEITHDRMVNLMVGRDLDRTAGPDSSSGGDAIFSVSGLRTRRYPHEEVAFDLRRGEILGLAGLVGAGRSEVAEAIFGVTPALGGTVKLGTTAVRIKAPRDAIQQGIYLVPEDRRRCGLIVEMTIRENITLPALDRYAVGGLLRANREDAVAIDAGRSLNVRAPATDFVVKNLSGGNQQKVVLARWLSLKPKVIIFDEPTRGIDVGAKAEIYDLMRKLAAEGVGVLMVSSDMEEVLNLSHRIAVMHEGRITGILDRLDCTEESVMRLAVGGAKEHNT